MIVPAKLIVNRIESEYGTDTVTAVLEPHGRTIGRRDAQPLMVVFTNPAGELVTGQEISVRLEYSVPER